MTEPADKPVTLPIREIVARKGELRGTSAWITVTQERIDRFADATDDHQFIHVDPERASAETAFGGTIAHGFLTLSLLSRMAMTGVPQAEEAVMGINYGFEKVRFLAPVPAGARIRGHFRLADCLERKPAEMLFTYEVSVELEGADTPALAATWLAMAILSSPLAELQPSPREQ